MSSVSKILDESPRDWILFFFINLSIWYYLLLIISCELISTFSSYLSGILNFFLKLWSKVKRIAVMIYLITYCDFIVIGYVSVASRKSSISYHSTILCKFIYYFNCQKYANIFFLAQKHIIMLSYLNILNNFYFLFTNAHFTIFYMMLILKLLSLFRINRGI